MSLGKQGSMNTTQEYSKIKSSDERLGLKNRDLHREITHHQYEYKIKKGTTKLHPGQLWGGLGKVLSHDPVDIHEYTHFVNDSEYVERFRCDDEYWEQPVDTYYHHPLLGWGSGFLLILFTLLFLAGEEIEFGMYVIAFISFMVLTFIAIYAIKQPKDKEFILDRLKGTVTSPTLYWQKNTTMSFEKIQFIKFPIFSFSFFNVTGFSPKKFGGSFDVNVGCRSYQCMTVLTWYMDRNRPLPTSPQFKPFHQKDFERRKKEGFPEPLFFSFVTDFLGEHSSLHHKERCKYWYDHVCFDKEKRQYKTCILRGADQIFDMKSRQWFNKSDIKKIDGEFYAYWPR